MGNLNIILNSFSTILSATTVIITLSVVWFNSLNLSIRYCFIFTFSNPNLDSCVYAYYTRCEERQQCLQEKGGKATCLPLNPVTNACTNFIHRFCHISTICNKSDVIAIFVDLKRRGRGLSLIHNMGARRPIFPVLFYLYMVVTFNQFFNIYSV